MSFGTRLNEILLARDMSPATLSKILNWNTGVISQYLNKPDRDPRLSTAVKIADALNVSLDYLAGRTDKNIITYPDAETKALVEGFSSLNQAGRNAIKEQMEFQMSKNSKKDDLQSSAIQEVA